MADYTEIIQEINTNLPDNNTQSITAAKMRTTLIDMLGAVDDVQTEFEGEINSTLSNFVEDTLYSTDTDKALSANQGYNLAATRHEIIIEGADNTLIKQPRIPVQPGHTYKLTLSNPNVTVDNITLSSGYSRLYVIASIGRTTTAAGTITVLLSVSLANSLEKEYTLQIPEATLETSYEWIDIQSRFDVGQTLVYYLEDMTNFEELENYIDTNIEEIQSNIQNLINENQVVQITKAEIQSTYEAVYSNKFPLAQYQANSQSNPAYYGLYTYYALGKNWTTLLESGTSTSHSTYKIPIDPEKYVIVSVNMYGSTSLGSSSPLACLVDENDIVLACITNNVGNGGYMTGSIIPTNAKYLILPVWTGTSYISNIYLTPRTNIISQNVEKVYDTLPYGSNTITADMFSADSPLLGGSCVPDISASWGGIGNIGKQKINDILASYYGGGRAIKLFYVEGYDEIEFKPFSTTIFSGYSLVLDREGNVIDAINCISVYQKYQLPGNACFFAFRGYGDNDGKTITLRKKSSKPLELNVMPHEGIGLTSGKLGVNGELNNLLNSEIYWTTSYIDLSRGFTMILNPEFKIVNAVLYNTDGTVANPYFLDNHSTNYTDFYSIANPIPGYLLRITVSPTSPTVDSEPITKYDTVIKYFTYLDNPDLTKTIPEDLPFEAYKNRVNKLVNVSEIARFDQWMDHTDYWNNEGQSVPMTSNAGEPKYWNTRYREGWYEVGTTYSEPSEYSQYVGQNVSLKTYVTALQNKRSVMYFERINSSVVNTSTIGYNKSRYGYTYRGLNSHYAGPFYGTVCTGLTGYVMGKDNVYISGDYTKRNAANDGPRIPNLVNQYLKKYNDVITKAQWDEMIDWLQPMDFIWQPGHCSTISDIYKDANGKTQLIVWTEEVRPFTKSRAYTREKFQERLQSILDQGSGNGFGLLRYTDWENADLTDYYDDDKYFSINSSTFKSNIKIDPEITTFRGEYVTFQIGDSSDSFNDYRAFLNIHRGVNKYNYLQIFNESDTTLTTPVKQIAISDPTTFPSDTLYSEDAYDKEDWIIFDLTNSTNMGGSVLTAGKYKARLYNSNNSTYSGFTHFEFIDFTFNATLDGTSIKASWSNFSDNATPYLIRQESTSGLCKSDASEYPATDANRTGQTYAYDVETSSGTSETVYTLTSGASWGTYTYTKIFVRGSYGCVARRIKTIN